VAGDTGGLQLSQDAAGDFANVATITSTIPASGSTPAETMAGNLTITGKAANTLGAYANAGVAGFLAGNTALNHFTGGTGSNFIDLSHLTTTAAVNGVTVNDSASAAGATNTVVLTDAVVSGATALNNMTNVQVIGDTAVGAGATINWSNMTPSGANTLQEFGLQVASVTINNTPSTFNVDVNGNDQGTFAIHVNALVAGSAFDLTVGNSRYENPALGLVNQYDHVGALTVGSALTSGYTNDTITSNGNAVAFNPTGVIALEANQIASADLWAGAAPITLTIMGQANLSIPGPGGAVPAVNLHGTAPTIIDNDLGVVVFSTASTVSTDAIKIDATNSGGLWMAAPDGGNTGSNGVTIIGSAAHPNYLFGSPGNDPMTGSSTTDTFITQGGGDVISLLAGHQNDAIDLYPTVGPVLANINPGSDSPGSSGADIITSGADAASGGFWGVVPGNPPAAIAASTFADVTTVQGPTPGTTGFIAGSASNADHLGFSAGAWGVAGLVLGLTDSSFAHITPPAFPGFVNAVSAPQGAGSTVGGGQDLIVTTAVAANAVQFATELAAGGSFPLIFGTALGAGKTAHVLMAYNDAAGNAHIADVDLHAVAAQTSTANMTVFASDMVTLTGVSDTALTSNNIHIIA
jgi:hypothetical protein